MTPRKIRWPFFKAVRFREEGEGGLKKGRSLDFSERGLRMITTEPVDGSRKLHLMVDEFEAVGRVAWVTKRTIAFLTVYDVGIEFEQFLLLRKNVLVDQMT